MPGMKADSARSIQSAAVWERMIELTGELSPSAARSLLRLRFSPADHAKMEELSAKARAGTLSAQEEATLDTFERLGCLLDILHSKARRARKKRKTAS
jgi:hypothetical protein